MPPVPEVPPIQHHAVTQSETTSAIKKIGKKIGRKTRIGKTQVIGKKVGRNSMSDTKIGKEIAHGKMQSATIVPARATIATIVEDLLNHSSLHP